MNAQRFLEVVKLITQEIRAKSKARQGIRAGLIGSELLSHHKAYTYSMVCLLFFMSVLIRGFTLNGPHLVTTYYDELLYWGLAKTFWTEPVFSLYHMPLQFSKFIYALVLSPLFLIKNPVLRSELAIWLNTIFMSFSVFPAYRLVKKITSSWKVQCASLVLFVCSPVMYYSKLYAPETLFLPLSLYLILGYYSLYQSISISEKCHLGKLITQSVILAMFTYITYLEKETASAFPCAFCCICFVATIKDFKHKGNSWHRFFLASLIHACVAVGCHILMKLVLGIQFSYSSQLGISNIDSMYKIEFFIHCVISNGLYVCAAFFGLPIIYWQLKKNHRNHSTDQKTAFDKWLCFLFVSFILILLFHSFSISLKEELGNTRMRLHTRYYITFLLPIVALTLEEIRKTLPQKNSVKLTGILVFGSACILLLSPNRYVAAYDSYDTWHFQDLNSFFDLINSEASNSGNTVALKPLIRFFANQTDGSKETVINHGVFFSMLSLTISMISIVLLIRRYKKIAFALLCTLVLVVEGYNNVITLEHISKFGQISQDEAKAYAQINDAIMEQVGSENILIINNSKLEAKKRKADTFFSFDWYSVLASDIKTVLGPDGVIELTTTQLPVSLKQFASDRQYPQGIYFPYVLCSNDVQFNEKSVELLLYDSKTGYYLYRIINPAVLDFDYVKGYYSD